MKKHLIYLTSLLLIPFLASCQSGVSEPDFCPETAEVVELSEENDVVMYAGHEDEDRIQTITGRFYHAMELEDSDGNPETLYQFRSDDGLVWWLLSAAELGFVPKLLDQAYCLTYDNSGTTAENKPCDCPPEYDCECEVYDDVFISASPRVPTGYSGRFSKH